MEHKGTCKTEIRLRGLDSKLEPQVSVPPLSTPKKGWDKGEASEESLRAHI